MSDTLKFGLQFGVPLVPLIVIVLLFAVGRLPDDGSERKPFVGVKNIVGPAVSRFWNGDGTATTYAAEADQERLEQPSRKPKQKTANPTNGAS